MLYVRRYKRINCLLAARLRQFERVVAQHKVQSRLRAGHLGEEISIFLVELKELLEFLVMLSCHAEVLPVFGQRLVYVEHLRAKRLFVQSSGLQERQQYVHRVLVRFLLLLFCLLEPRFKQ